MGVALHLPFGRIQEVIHSPNRFVRRLVETRYRSPRGRHGSIAWR